MAGGGKGGSQTSKVEIPAWLEQAAQRNIARAEDLSTLGYTPYYGPDVAALTPMQEAAMANVNRGAAAFGLGAPTAIGAPTAQDYGGGVRGYGSGGLYEQALAELQARMPGQYSGLQAPFRDPLSGAMPGAPYAPNAAIPSLAAAAAAAAGTPYASGSSDAMWSDGMSPAQISQAQQDRTFGAQPSAGGSGSGMLGSLMSYAPGGVNTANPSSVFNQIAASLSKPQSAPTAASRPMARPTTR